MKLFRREINTQDVREKISFGSLGIEVTRRCNLTCEHCMRGNAQDIDISYEALNNLLNQTCAIQKLLLTGGEPLIAKDKVIYIIDEIVKRKIILLDFQVITNGMYFDEEIAEATKRLFTYMDTMFNNIADGKLSRDYTKNHIDYLISSDRFHKNNSENQYDKIEKMIGDYAHVSLYNIGNSVKAIGRGNQLDCGTYVSKYRQNKICLYGKNEPCVCRMITKEKIENQKDFYTVMCPVELTSKGFVIPQMEAEYETEDKEQYNIANMNMNDPIVNSIREYNKDKQICVYTEESNLERYKNQDEEQELKNIRFFNDRTMSNEEKEKSDKYKSYTYEGLGEDLLKLTVGATQQEKTRNLLKNEKIYSSREMELLYKYGYDYEDLIIRYHYLNKEELDKVRSLYRELKINSFNKSARNILKSIIVRNFEKEICASIGEFRAEMYETEKRSKAYRQMLIELNGDKDKLYDLYLKSYVAFNDDEKMQEFLATRKVFETFLDENYDMDSLVVHHLKDRLSKIISDLGMENWECTEAYDELYKRVAYTNVYKMIRNSKKFKNRTFFINEDISDELLENTTDSVNKYYNAILKYDFLIMQLQNGHNEAVGENHTYNSKDIEKYAMIHFIESFEAATLLKAVGVL